MFNFLIIIPIQMDITLIKYINSIVGYKEKFFYYKS